ncbi:MAG: DUF3187 family protein [Leptospiraceae bacterium]|nr:DUF3187 family protein [Leptospiraceae bacterium]MCP5510860.1 DUF3187 family protein [Leptospiraceae bacterium]
MICLGILFHPLILSANEQLDIPLDIRNEYAPTLLFLQPRATTPIALKKGQSRINANLSLINDIKNSRYNVERDIPYAYQKPILREYFLRYSGTYQEAGLMADYYRFGHLNRQYQTVIDMEYTVSRVQFDYGISDSFELGIGFTGYSFNTGILDSTINTYHSIMGVRTGKENLPDNEFKYLITGTRSRIIQSKPHSGLGDTLLSGKWNFYNDGSGFSLALVGIVKLATGKSSLAMGSGKTDGSLGISMKYRSNRLVQFLNLNGIYVSNPFLNDTIRARSYGMASYGIGYNWTEDLSLMIQLDIHSSPYSSQTLLLSQPSAIFSCGFNLKVLESSLWQLGLMEDITFPVPDITFFSNWKTVFD